MKAILNAGVSRIALRGAMPKRDLEREAALTKAARKLAKKIKAALRKVKHG